MSGSVDEDPAVLAGEYVLGLLDTAEMRRVEALAQTDSALAGEIGFWEDNLAPLTQMVAPVQPPPVLWSRLALAAGIGSAAGEMDTRRRAGSPRFWQGATAAALAIAACFAYLAFLPQPLTQAVTGTPFVAAIGPMNQSTAFVAQSQADGSIAVTRVAGAGSAATGRDYELWALPSGATRPIPLGVLPASGTVVHPTDRPLANEQLLVSDEPAGGSPTGQPTGAVLFGGTLTPVTPAPAPGR